MPDTNKPFLALHGGKPVRTTPLPPWPNYEEEEIQAVVAVLRSGKHARQSGTQVSQFERDFAARFGVRHAVAVSSGTAAIHVALAALGIGPGDDVINTPHCFIGTATPVVHVGAVPVFADIDPRTFNMDPATILPRLTPYTRAIIPVHLNGCPADMDPILEIARQHNLFVIEDAAQAHGAEYKGRLVGSIGDIACFSFWEDKLISTAGEGGMLITDDEDLAQRARRFQHHGEERRDGDYYQGERLYLHKTLGYNYRMTEIQGALGIVQLKRLDSYIAHRRSHAHRLTELLSGIEGLITPYEPPDISHVFYKYILRLDRRYLAVPALEFAAALRSEGIPCSRRYPTPLHQQPVFVQHRGYGGGPAPFEPPWYAGETHYGSGCPVAESLPEDLLTLPMRPTYREQDLADIAAALIKVVRYYRSPSSS
jgi:dTDP-4-amino-4,6-dideoxygalactose transaminase